jgi:hypothetical protein
MTAKQHIDAEPQRCEECERNIREIIAEKDAIIAVLKDEIRFLQDQNNQRLEKITHLTAQLMKKATVPLLKETEVSDTHRTSNPSQS